MYMPYHLFITIIYYYYFLCSLTVSSVRAQRIILFMTHFKCLAPSRHSSLKRNGFIDFRAVRPGRSILRLG